MNSMNSMNSMDSMDSINCADSLFKFSQTAYPIPIL